MIAMHEMLLTRFRTQREEHSDPRNGEQLDESTFQTGTLPFQIRRSSGDHEDLNAPR